MTPQEAIREMLFNTHTLFTEEHGKRIAKAFGLELDAKVYKADYGDPKGLHLDDGSKQAKGFACFELAPLICYRLGVKYESMMGRGFQVQACCKALQAHIEGHPK